LSRYQAEVSAYIAGLPSPQREMCQLLRDLILERFGQISEEWKWRRPGYYWQGRRICLTGGFQAHVNVELFYGALLVDAQGRITGQGKYTRHIKYRCLAEIDGAYFADLIQQSIDQAQIQPR
jgi:hypothetical protein